MYVWGHRGANTHKRFQNTLTSLTYGLEISQGIETDCVASADNTLYLIHDMATDKLKRIIHEDHHKNIGDRRFDQLTDTEIQTLRLNNGDPIPTLEQFLNAAKAYKNKTLNLELKGDHLAALVLDCVHHTDYGDNDIIYSSFNHPQLETLRTLDQNCSIGILYGLYDHDEQPMYKWDPKSDDLYIPPREENIDLSFYKNLKASYLHIEADSFVNHAYRYIPKEIPVTLWTMGINIKAHEDEALLKALSNPDINKNIHAVIVDYPEEMASVLKQANLLTAPK